MRLKNYRVVDFAHIDDYRCIRPLRESVGDGHSEADKTTLQEEELQLREELATLFKKAGWEGDGKIGCIFIPPCFVRGGYSNCEVVYHVKQSNNGTSWLAVPKGLDLTMPEGFLASGK